jgi:hypothetical protein
MSKWHDISCVTLYVLYIELCVQGKRGTAGQSNGEDKTETVCWLCDRYGDLVRDFRLRNFRLIR